MRKAEVKVGETYAVKVSGQIAPVVIDEAHPGGGWVGTNQETNRQVRIKSAQRLRCLWDDYLARGEVALATTGSEASGANTGPQGEKKPKREAKAARAQKKPTRAKRGAPSTAPGTSQERGMSGLDAGAKVLKEANEPLNCKEIVKRAFEKGYWRSEGKTPAATIYSAILREIQKKGDQARFRKAARGRFELAR